MKQAAWAASVLLAIGCAGCRVADVEPVPLRGPAPDAIGIWPIGNETAGGHAGDLLEGFDRAVRARGYRGPSREVGSRMLFDSPTTAVSPTFTDNEPGRLGQLLDVDAIFVLEVRRFAAEGEPLRSASWDLQWQLHSTRGHGVSWTFEHAGSWQRPRDDEDPLRPLDAEPGIVPIGEPRTPGFRDVRELANWLHRHAMARLPALSR